MVYGIKIFNELYEKAGYENLSSVNDDEEWVDSLFKLMKILPENIRRFKDANYDEIN